jgi:hypothetical protein
MLQKFIDRLQKGQRIAADWLQYQSRKLRPRTVALLLVLFCCACSSAFGFLILQSIRHPAPFLVISPVRVPAYVNHPSPAALDSPREQPLLRHVQSIGHYLDSLRDSPAGKSRYDSLVHLRPHLLDSLHQLQQLFSHSSTITP